jgi:Zn-dependent protease
MDTISGIIFQLLVLLFSVIIHEVSHGFIALKLGDETAKNAGRLTLNPIKHLDPFGSFLIPVFLYFSGSPFILGWAKPVPYNPNFLYKDYKYGPLKVALAGPAANIVIAIFFGLIIRLSGTIFTHITINMLGFVVFLNILLAIFNLIPIPPLDGSKILTTFLSPQKALFVERISMMGIFLVLIFLFLFSDLIFKLVSLLFNVIVGNGISMPFI